MPETETFSSGRTRPKLTIGMAHYADFDGVYFTVQSLRLHHAETMPDVELIVVDNSPHLPEAEPVKGLMDAWARHGTAGSRYVPMADNGGTTQTRQRIFDEAAGEAVLCCDCHVLFAPGSIRRLIDFYASGRDEGNLLQGPMMMDNMKGLCTHFDNIWRSEMQGIWGHAWSCPCGETAFSVLGDADCNYRRLDAGASPLEPCPACGSMPPPLPRAGHDAALARLGFRRPGDDPDGEPFEIPANGLGVFSSRKDAWLGFNPHFRGFGGEECYIHEKYRRAGRRTLCLPFLRWLHRFGRPGGVKYPLTVWNKVRNYVLGRLELGQDLGPVHDHFVPVKLTEEQWAFLIADPVGRTSPPVEHRGGCGSCKKELEKKTLREIHDFYAAQENDFNRHFPKISELAARCRHVTEFGSRDYGVAALAGGNPRRIVSYNTATDGAAFWRLEQIARQNGKLSVRIMHDDPLATEIEDTDLLFIDRNHDAEWTHAALSRHAHRLRRYIVIHDTELFGVTGEGGRPGIKLGLSRFMAEHREWTVVHSTPEQHGLMVLSKNREDKPKRPGIVAMGANYIRHTAEYVADGMEDVSPEQLKARLEVCWLCDLRTANEQCSMCGCPLVPKAKRRASRCDANKWIDVDKKFAGGSRKRKGQMQSKEGR